MTALGRDILCDAWIDAPLDLAAFDGPVVYPSGAGRNILIVRLAPDGRFMWATTIAGADAKYSAGIVRRADGDLLVVGRTQSTMIAGGDTLRPQGGVDMFFVRVSGTTGKILGGWILGTPSDDAVFTPGAMPGGGYLFAGNFVGTLDFGGGVVRYHATRMGFVARFDAYDRPVWVYDAPWDLPYAQHDVKGTIFLRRGNSIVCLSPDGVFLWEEPVAVGNYTVHSIGVTGQGVVYVAGMLGSSAPIDFGEGVVLPPTSPWWDDGIATYSSFLVEFRADTVVPTRLADHAVTVEGGVVRITWRLLELASDATFAVERAPEGTGRWRVLPARPGAGVEPLTFAVRDTTVTPGKTYRYRVTVREGGVQSVLFQSDPVTVPGVTTRIVSMHPNPFTDGAAIDFVLDNDARVTVDVFDVAGRRVARVVEQRFSAGRHRVNWMPRDADVPSGVYFVRLRAGSGVDVRKVVRMHAAR